MSSFHVLPGLDLVLYVREGDDRMLIEVVELVGLLGASPGPA